MSTFISARNRGFSLVELVMVITISGILLVVIAPLLGRPFSLFNDIQTRASLVDKAHAALAAVTRRVRQAVPNSVRVSGGALELMPINFAGRYPLVDDVSDIDGLTPRQLDNSFSIFGNVPNLTGQRLIVNPTSTVLLYAAAADSLNQIMTPSTSTLSVTDNGNQDRITIFPAFRFDPSGNGSPARRVFVTTGPQSMICDGGNLTLFENYTATVNQPTSASSASLSSSTQSLVSESVSSCQFRFSPGTAQRSALLTMELVLTENGESIRLIEQMHVENIP